MDGTKQKVLEFPIKPGRYKLRVAKWLPKIKVSVFRNSVQQQDELRMRYAGMVLKPGSMLARGSWEGPLPS